MTDQAKGLLITSLAVLLVIPESLLVRLFDAHPFTILFWRSFTLSISTGIWVLFVYGREGIATWIKPSRYHVMYGGFNLISAAMFIYAVTLTSVANTVFILASLPVFAAIFSRIFLGERVSLRLQVTIILVLIGVSIIAFGSDEQEGASLIGNLLAIGAALFFAAALTTARAARPLSIVPIVPAAFMVGALLCLFITNPFTVTPAQYPIIVLHGGVLMAGAMILFAIGPRFISSAEASLLILGESIGAPLLVWAVLGEFPGQWTLVGGAMILTTLIVSNVIALRKAKK